MGILPYIIMVYIMVNYHGIYIYIYIYGIYIVVNYNNGISPLVNKTWDLWIYIL